MSLPKWSKFSEKQGRRLGAGTWTGWHCRLTFRRIFSETGVCLTSETVAEGVHRKVYAMRDLLKYTYQRAINLSACLSHAFGVRKLLCFSILFNEACKYIWATIAIQVCPRSPPGSLGSQSNCWIFAIHSQHPLNNTPAENDIHSSSPKAFLSNNIGLNLPPLWAAATREQTDTMPKALTPQQKATVTTMLAEKAPQRDIANAASCSVSQIKRMAKNIRRWGKPVAPKLVPQGRPRTLSQDVAEVSPPHQGNWVDVVIGTYWIFQTTSICASWRNGCIC
jgi:hypothetical protein